MHELNELIGQEAAVQIPGEVYTRLSELFKYYQQLAVHAQDEQGHATQISSLKRELSVSKETLLMQEMQLLQNKTEITELHEQIKALKKKIKEDGETAAKASINEIKNEFTNIKLDTQNIKYRSYCISKEQHKELQATVSTLKEENRKLNVQVNFLIENTDMTKKDLAVLSASNIKELSEAKKNFKELMLQLLESVNGDQEIKNNTNEDLKELGKYVLKSINSNNEKMDELQLKNEILIKNEANYQSYIIDKNNELYRLFSDYNEILQKKEEHEAFKNKYENMQKEYLRLLIERNEFKKFFKMSTVNEDLLNGGTENKILELENQELKNNLLEIEISNSQLKEENVKNKAAVSRAEADVKDYQDEIEKMHREIEQYQDEIAHIKNEYQEAQELLVSKKQALSKTNDNTTFLEKSNVKYKKELEEVKKAFENYKERVKEGDKEELEKIKKENKLGKEYINKQRMLIEKYKELAREVE
ncbi:hypothetical protein ENBRE01_2699 [Enteropsectra breve]|nr:hypothetical protein ENBRE01_2228 [Enteropsectra breve]KAI5152271.1 hypothetical protein ENBRE01_2699 [Enteropsectra breve]